MTIYYPYINSNDHCSDNKTGWMQTKSLTKFISKTPYHFSLMHKNETELHKWQQVSTGATITYTHSSSLSFESPCLEFVMIDMFQYNIIKGHIVLTPSTYKGLYTRLAFSLILLCFGTGQFHPYFSALLQWNWDSHSHEPTRNYLMATTTLSSPNPVHLYDTLSIIVSIESASYIADRSFAFPLPNANIRQDLWHTNKFIVLT